MERAVEQAAAVRGIERVRERVEQRQRPRRLDRGGSSRCRVERWRRDVLLDQERRTLLDADGHGHDDGRMKRPGARRTLQDFHDQPRLLRRGIDPQFLDDEGAVVGRVVGAEDRPQDADPDLMQDAEGTERTRAA